MNDITHYLSVKYGGDWFKVYKAIVNAETIPNDQINTFLNTKEGILENTNILEITDDKYPHCFKLLKQPPFVIYYSNNLSMFNKRWIWLDDPNCALKENELLKIHLSGYGFVVYDLVTNKQLIKRLVKNNYKVLIVCNKAILHSQSYEYINHKNVWLISEIPSVNNEIKVSQDLKRLCCSLAEFIICVNELNHFDEYLINKVHDLDKQLFLHTNSKQTNKTNFPLQINNVNEIAAFKNNVN